MGELLDDMGRRDFMSRVRSALLTRIEQGGRAPYTGGPTAGQFGVMSASQPTAAESSAFNDRIRDKAVFGSYGQGGIERERIVGEALSELAKRQMTPKDRADIELKRKEQELRKEGKWNWKAGDDWGEGGGGDERPGKRETPTSNIERPTLNQGQGQGLGGERIGGAQRESSKPQAQSSKGQEGIAATVPAIVPGVSGGGITIPPGSANKPTALGGTTAKAGTYSAPGEYDPGLGRRMREDGQQSAAPPVAAPAPNLADVVRALEHRQDPGMWTGYEGPKSDEKQVSRKDAKTQSGQKEKIPGLAETVMQVIADMFVRAPAQAIGEENIAAAGNTLADMFYRGPKKTIKQNPALVDAMMGRLPPEVISAMERSIGTGTNWLSQQVLGGVR